MPLPDELAFATVDTLGQRLRAREFSAVELTEFFLQRLERLGGNFNAVVCVTRKLAIRQARQADDELSRGIDRGPLHGIPYGAKDLLATRGIPTTWGAVPYRNRVIDNDATVVTRLQTAGAVLAAKLALVELAGGFGYTQADAALTGPGRNPWNPKTWAGGSSSGSAAAVAAGLVPFSIGSETSGSILTPAGYCGVTGLRPTYGVVSRYGAMTLSWTMDKLGPLARTAADCRLILNAIAGNDPLDPSTEESRHRHQETQPRTGKFRLLLLKDATRHVHPDVARNFDRALKSLGKVAELVEGELPDFPYSAVAGTIIDAEMSAALSEVMETGANWELTAPEDRLGGYAPQLVLARDYINALRIRGQISRGLGQLLTDCDAIATPTLATTAPPLDEDFATARGGYRGTPIVSAGNVAGLPAISVPNGRDEDGLPTGLQLVGGAFGEDRLLAVAEAFQQSTEWHCEHPAV